MRWPVSLLLVGSLSGCDAGPLDASPPPPPPARSFVACDELARQTPAARWEDTGTWSPASLVVTDASRLGGPFASPPRLADGAAVTARVLVVDETRGGASAPQALCVQLRLGPGAPTTWKDSAGVPLDAGLLVIGDEGAMRRALRPTEAPLAPCIEGPGEDLDRVVGALAARGLKLTPVLPTLRCLEGARPPFDLEPLRAAMREHKAEGRAFVEARSPAWPLLDTLGDKAWARFAPGADGVPSALVIEVRSGEGAYPVRLGHDGDGKLVAAEVSLR